MGRRDGLWLRRMSGLCVCTVAENLAYQAFRIGLSQVEAEILARARCPSIGVESNPGLQRSWSDEPIQPVSRVEVIGLIRAYRKKYPKLPNDPSWDRWKTSPRYPARVYAEWIVCHQAGARQVKQEGYLFLFFVSAKSRRAVKITRNFYCPSEALLLLKELSRGLKHLVHYD